MQISKGPHTSGKAHPNHATPPLPADLAAVALINARTAAAAGSMSLSWWHQKVAEGEAPQPVVRAQRCTRWRAVDVAAFWRAFANQATVSGTDATTIQATKASTASIAKRRTLAALGQAED
jgi:predicted DNA-binding transcriptional regulator AlpA